MKEVQEEKKTSRPDMEHVSETQENGSVESDERKTEFGENKGTADRISEPQAAYRVTKKQGEYTLEDYYAWPEEERIELIEGVIYAMSAPTYSHQDIAGEIYFQMRNFFDGKQCGCRPMISPVDVRINRDNKTMVQPDVIILCDKEKRRRWGIDGAPEFLLEILSPSTRKKDITIKPTLYMEAGVREYWIIDPKNKRLIVYDFESKDITQILPLQGKQPVGITNGELLIDLDAVVALLDPEEE